ncbi:MAG: glycosyltransferase family A protein [Candidatus Diapherotrites archaeon]
MKILNVSVIVATKNRAKLLRETLGALQCQNFSAFEIIVVDDGSTDETAQIVGHFSGIKYLKNKGKGPAAARNAGIRASKGKIIAVMDNDCIAEKDWLKKLVAPFEKNQKVGITTSFNEYGGTSTAYRKDVLEKAGLFDEEFPSNYREDTDTVFKVQDLGFTVVRTRAEFEHKHEAPKGLAGKLSYAWSRVWKHEVDPLLYKKHPERTREFLKIKWNFWRPAREDFKVATGLWKKQFGLSSPQGIQFIENKSFLHAIAIVLSGIAYVVLVKAARVWGSVRFGKLLV